MVTSGAPNVYLVVLHLYGCNPHIGILTSGGGNYHSGEGQGEAVELYPCLEVILHNYGISDPLLSQAPCKTVSVSDNLSN